MCIPHLKRICSLLFTGYAQDDFNRIDSLFDNEAASEAPTTIIKQARMATTDIAPDRSGYELLNDP